MMQRAAYYYLIFKHTGSKNTKATYPSYIVQSKEVAENFCKEFSEFYFEERIYETSMVSCEPGRAIEDNNSITDLMSGMMSDDLLKQKDLPKSTLNYLTEPKGLYDDIVCPYCGKKHFIELYSTSTALAVVKEYKDGKLVDHPNPNIYITHFRCCECGKEFISDNGVIKKVAQQETPDLNLNWTKDSNLSIEDYYNDNYSYDDLTVKFKEYE